MRFLITFFHVLSALTLIMVVLLQTGKGTNMGAAFGGASQTVFGSSGASTFLGKLTAGVAVVFILTSLSLSYFTAPRQPGLLDERPARPVTEPAVPLPAPPAPAPGAK